MNILGYTLGTILFALLIAIIFCANPGVKAAPDLGIDVCVSLLTGFGLLLLLECRDYRRDIREYGQLAGVYRREDIYGVIPKADSETKYISMKEAYNENPVPPEVTFRYLGGRQYSVEADYLEGKVNATVFLNETNPEEGVGTYQYDLPERKMDIGRYLLKVDQNNPGRLILFHENLIPSGLAQGYEVLVKIK